MPDLNETLNALQLISLSIITGGTITIGALTAPLLFKNLNREEAGAVMVDMFSRFDKWIRTFAIILLGSKLVQIVMINHFDFFISSGAGEELVKTFNMPLMTSLMLVLAIAAVSLFMGFKLSPQIIQSYENNSPEFHKLHGQSENLHKLNFVLGFALLIMFAF